MSEVLIWSKGNCLPCEMLKEWIEGKEYTVTFKDSDVEKPKIKLGQEIVGYPTLQYEGELVMGYQDIQDWLVNHNA